MAVGILNIKASNFLKISYRVDILRIDLMELRSIQSLVSEGGVWFWLFYFSFTMELHRNVLTEYILILKLMREQRENNLRKSQSLRNSNAYINK